MIDVMVAKGNVHFPSICPVCLVPDPSAKVTISDKEGHLGCDIAYCDRCARRIGWRRRYFPTFGGGPGVRVRGLSDKWVVFRFKSTRYADLFLEINSTAFKPDRRWRRSTARKGLNLILKFAVVYSIYLAIFLPIAHADMVEIVPLIGIPFAAGSVYIWSRLPQRKD